jgi:hypothetical protein
LETILAGILGVFVAHKRTLKNVTLPLLQRRCVCVRERERDWRLEVITSGLIPENIPSEKFPIKYLQVTSSD